MNLQHLQYFVELAHTHSYTLSAERLHISQPNLSYGISQLEKELGVCLIEKNGRTNVLTDFGRQFLVYAEGTLNTLNAGITAVHQSAIGGGTIRIGALRFLGVHYIPELISSFKKEHPDLNVSFVFETGSTKLLLDGLDSGRFDYVFCSPSRDTWFEAAEVKKQTMMLVIPEEHPLAGRESITLDETRDYPYVYFAKGSSLRNILDRLLEGSGFVPKISMEIMEEQVIAGFIANGFGIGILPEEPYLKLLPVKVIPITEPHLVRNVFMLWNRRVYMAPLLKEFCLHVKRRTNESN